MFRQVRIKLTLYYLAIIMVISVFFSLIIYRGATFELQRIETRQAQRGPMIGPPFVIDPEVIQETKSRIALSLFATNIVILAISAVSGYFLAGKTLEPIKKNMEEQKEFIGSASHELRTPLTSLKTEIEVGLRDKKLTISTAKKILISNLEEVNKMQKLSDYLLRLNRLESGKSVFEMSKVDLRKVVTNAIGKRNVKSDLKSSIVMGSEDALTELVAILLDNAFKYSPKAKGVSVKIKDKQIEISDKGGGIQKKDLPHIFDRFYRGDKSRTKDGYGLGLSIAKQIADLHGAKIKVDSKLGTGSTFKVIFS
ncbi:MAG: Histidine kinase [Candidatus Woesebacteria bacterium GW2011_GWA2_40_7b]|uniref:histidine kinase n=1 Tax=Candidatus Woesebacteria bacterium GW2011_GWA2_40_7b TaxID=1618563 RepID=A0A0G0T2H8_9BACT|nr:MAG: Histidine kinase [Candidatus Woesebacteria bacterium GW2011_GWA2_40_7b]